jgi:hypothetical protein
MAIKNLEGFNLISSERNKNGRMNKTPGMCAVFTTCHSDSSAQGWREVTEDASSVQWEVKTDKNFLEGILTIFIKCP